MAATFHLNPEISPLSAIILYYISFQFCKNFGIFIKNSFYVKARTMPTCPEKLSKIFSTTIYTGFLIFVLSLPVGLTSAFLNIGLSLILLGWLSRAVLERFFYEKGLPAISNISWQPTPLGFPIVLFLFLGLIGSLFAPHPSTSSLGYFWKLLRAILLFYAVIHSRLDVRWRDVVCAFILAAGISSALGIWYYANDRRLALDFMGKIPLEYEEELSRRGLPHLSAELRAELRKHNMPLSSTAVLTHSKGEFWIEDAPRARRYTIRKSESGLMVYMIEPRLTGTFKMPNDLGAYLALMFPFTLGYFIASLRTRLISPVGTLWQRAWVSIALGLVLVLMSVNLILTLTRAAWVSVAIATFCIICYWLITVPKNRWIYLSILLLCFLPFLILFKFNVFNVKSLQHITSRFQTMIEHPQGFMGERPKWWGMSLQLMRQYPLNGIGLGRFRHEYQLNTSSEQYDMPYHAHNIYLHIAVEHGIPSLFLFIWMLVLIWRELFLMRQATGFSGLGRFIGTSGFLISALIYGLADNVLHHRSLLIFWFILGLLFYSEYTERNNEKTSASD